LDLVSVEPSLSPLNEISALPTVAPSSDAITSESPLPEASKLTKPSPVESEFPDPFQEPSPSQSSTAAISQLPISASPSSDIITSESPLPEASKLTKPSPVESEFPDPFQEPSASQSITAAISQLPISASPSSDIITSESSIPEASKLTKPSPLESEFPDPFQEPSISLQIPTATPTLPTIISTPNPTTTPTLTPTNNATKTATLGATPTSTINAVIPTPTPEATNPDQTSSQFSFLPFLTITLSILLLNSVLVSSILEEKPASSNRFIRRRGRRAREGQNIDSEAGGSSLPRQNTSIETDPRIKPVVPALVLPPFSAPPQSRQFC
jgi:hypothetical protein